MLVKIIARILSHIWYFSPKAKRLAKRFQIESWLYGRRVRRIAKSVGPVLTMHKASVVSPTTTIGNYCALSGVKIFGQGEVTIGDHTFIGDETIIFSQNHNYDTDDNIPLGSKWVLKPVRIDDCVLIFTRCIILPGTHIGEGAIIQAGSVVHGEIPPFAIAGGNPAKVFAWRDKAHYEELKAKKAFARGV